MTLVDKCSNRLVDGGGGALRRPIECIAVIRFDEEKLRPRSHFEPAEISFSKFGSIEFNQRIALKNRSRLLHG